MCLYTATVAEASLPPIQLLLLFLFLFYCLMQNIFDLFNGLLTFYATWKHFIKWINNGQQPLNSSSQSWRPKGALKRQRKKYESLGTQVVILFASLESALAGN